MSNPKRFVDILASIRAPASPLVVIEFDEEEPALAFEQYLKTGSGREFARRHFRQHVRAP